MAAGAILLAAGCGGDGSDGPPPTAEVVDCGLTNPSHGAAHPFVQVRVTNAGDEAGRVRVVVRFLAGGEEIGVAEAETPELPAGGAGVLNATMEGTAEAVDDCEVVSSERI